MSRAALAATRAMGVIDLLAAHPGEAFTLSEIARRLDVNLASTHAILGTLTASGHLSRHPRHRTFTLGPALVATGSAALVAHPAIEAAREAAGGLAADTALQATVTALAGDAVVFVASAGRQQPHGVDVRVGQRVPLVPPLGTVFYAWAPPEEVDAWLSRGRLAAPDGESLRAVLSTVRARGCSIGLEAPGGATSRRRSPMPPTSRLRPVCARKWRRPSLGSAPPSTSCATSTGGGVTT